MKRLAIFASGNGTNFQYIVEYFSKESSVEIAVLVCNNPNAFVVQRAKKLNVPVLIVQKSDVYTSSVLKNELLKLHIDLIVLAGFLWLIPQSLIDAFPKKIINIHPALLPMYGGKGMYGEAVHRAVIDNKEKYSGITIHYVNASYDEGECVFQKKIECSENETTSGLAQRIHALEHEYYPAVIAQLLGIKTIIN